MNGHLITADGASHELNAASVQGLIDSGTHFWADIEGVDSETLSMLSDTFRFHPLAVEDVEHFGQRPKIDMYDDFALLVVYGTTRDAHLAEVHCFYSERYLVTVHTEPCPDFSSLVERLERRGGPGGDHVMLLYRVIDTLVDGYFPVLSTLDDRIDDLEDEILQRPTEDQLGQLFDMKRSLIALRKVVTPQRDMFASMLGSGDTLPGMTPDAERYFRDLYDHLIRISDLVDSYRDLLSGALDTHLSTVSNRLNVVMKQLTIIATIFLPLSFLTGFFGQNFGWMVDRITSFPVFIGAGVGLQVAVVVGLLVLFRRRGWLSSDGTLPPATPATRARPSRDRRWHVLRT
ncbi:MAG TPA: magnesium/cobalt transporter CorA [Acidimicrobiales bacterium]|nr:magnesium/cobalt transporter CorA [Acidimicrobiales bacterium]